MRIVLPDAEKVFIEKLGGRGVFLSVGAVGDWKPNTMTIGWGSIGVYWNMDILTVCVRPQRHTFGMLNQTGEFTVSVPGENPLLEELAFAGRASGRDTDKFSGHGLTAAKAKHVSAPIVEQCPLHFECVVRAKSDLRDMDEQVRRKNYPGNDFHMLYMAEIVACYTTKA